MAKKKAARTPKAMNMLFPPGLIGHPDARALEAAVIITLTAAVNRLVNRYWLIAATQVGTATRRRISKAVRAHVAIRKGKR